MEEKWLVLVVWVALFLIVAAYFMGRSDGEKDGRLSAEREHPFSFPVGIGDLVSARASDGTVHIGAVYAIRQHVWQGDGYRKRNGLIEIQTPTGVTNIAFDNPRDLQMKRILHAETQNVSKERVW